MAEQSQRNGPEPVMDMKLHTCVWNTERSPQREGAKSDESPIELPPVCLKPREVDNVMPEKKNDNDPRDQCDGGRPEATVEDATLR